MGIGSFFKDAFKERITLETFAGGEQLSEKHFPNGVRQVVMLPESQRGLVTMEIPFTDKQKFRLVDIEWQEQAKRSGGKAFLGGAGGALVGGVVGAAAGAAIGGRRRDNSRAFVYLLPADVEPSEVTEADEIVLHIECDQAKYKKIASLRG